VKVQLTPTELRELLAYNPITGVVRWRVTCGRRAKAGAIAGSKSQADRYWRIRIKGRLYLLHRVIYALMKGVWPDDLVDHRDTNADNNRWLNLRPATNSQNGANRSATTKNQLGTKGVFYSHRHGMYVAKIRVNGKGRTLGYRPTVVEAKALYDKAAVEAFGPYFRAS